MSEAGEIHQLDPTTVERIAAGEVVERPASAVKELLENSLDAGADRIDVRIEGGGTESITVVDDGHGMTETAVRQAVREHTTSKIASIDDLEAGVGTLGFRGEALHAIGAVSRLTVRSRPPDADRGTELEMVGGEAERVEPAGCAAGTTVTVDELFFNVPARRKYLAAESTEFAHVTRIVRGYALTAPEVAISLTHDGREVFATAGDGDRRTAAMAVYGREVAESLIDVETTLSAGPLDRVAGVVSHPETTRSSREYTVTAVNGRYVRADVIRDAVIDAYGGHLDSDRYPFAVIDVQVDPGAVDVNVHPRKLEVRFPDDGAAREQLREAVREALSTAGVVRTGAPRGRSRPAETPIEPGAGDAGGTGGGVVSAEGDPDSSGRTAGRSGTDRSRPEEPSTATGDAASSDADGAADGGPSTAASSSRDRPGEREAALRDRAETPARREQSSAGPSRGTDGDAAAPGTDREPATAPDRSAGGRARLPTTQLDLDGADAGRLELESLPAMRLFGQLDETYLVAASGTDLLLLDQHAADERIAYERLRAKLDGEIATQALADPVELSVTAGEAAILETRIEALTRLGFRAARVGEHTVELRTVPALFEETLAVEGLRDALAAALSGGDPGDTVEAAVDALLADLACAPAVTAHTSLSTGSIRALLEALDDCAHPYSCPHGRPTIVTIDSEEIATRFERDYPGHR